MYTATKLNAADIARLAGSDFEYRYKELSKSSDAEIRRYIERTRSLAAPIAANFNDERNAEWFIRSYLALKLILASTLLANTALYARDHNLQAVRPYLSYYLMLNCCRAFIFTLPCVPWKGLTTIEATHSKILNIASDKLKRLSANEERRCGSILRIAQEQRNLFSYRFPATGLSLFGASLVDLDVAIDIARLFTELAQLNLACLEGEIRKKTSDAFSIPEADDMWHTLRYKTAAQDFIDDDDYYRVGYFHRKYTGPVALVGMATEGLVEDFFGAWSGDNQMGFDPDIRNDLLLDLL
ncbi:hypothetical protein [Acetobacter fabarum]|uniref:hypothetical protein n=1 Tax=Acetobacter fabarum TaxID=483199 RepID=UPI0020A15D88|nr:hypothetical protein [Acetobacter fabarum]MCP1229208.1 hypothetical protein [Acetobacter fabarum]MCP1234691.1 hypothetical protein [Acetobacter fabarum]